MKRIFIFIITYLAIVNGLFPAIVGNWICKTYPAQCTEGEDSSGPKYASIHSGATVRDYIKTAGYNFLTSKANWCRFISEYEINGEIVTFFLDESINRIEKAHIIYQTLYEYIVGLDYDNGTIEKLKEFDYDSLQKKYSLNPTIFCRLKNMLKDGNVQNVFKEFRTMTGEIAAKLNQARENPTLSKIWDISHDFNTIELFGQYVARVFHEL